MEKLRFHINKDKDAWLGLPKTTNKKSCRRCLQSCKLVNLHFESDRINFNI